MKTGGFAELTKKLKDLKGRVAGSIQRKAITAGCREVQKLMKALARKGDTGALKQSIGTKVKIFRTSRTAVGIVGPRTKFEKTKQLGKLKQRTIFRRPSKYAHLVDRGTRRSRAFPFVNPSVQATKARAIAAMEEKAAEELARAK